MSRRTKKSREFTVILDPEKYAEAKAQLEKKLDRRITHEQIAREVGISRAQLDYLRRGKCSPSAETIMTMMRAFDLSFEELFVGVRVDSRGAGDNQGTAINK